MATWASRANPTPAAVNAIQADLTVRLVMTERVDLMTCHPGDTVDSIAKRKVDQFSVLPVEVDREPIGTYTRPVLHVWAYAYDRVRRKVCEPCPTAV